MRKAPMSTIIKGLIRFFISSAKVLCIIAIVGAIIIFVNVQSSIAQNGLKNGEKSNITILQPKEAYELIKKNSGNPDFVVLDIRTSKEFLSGHIPGAINIDYYSHAFVANIEHLDKKKTYFIYCRTGRRTSEAVKIMLRKGFVNIYTSYGDIVAWQAAGLPLAKGTDNKGL